jgi:hypothetical protein
MRKTILCLIVAFSAAIGCLIFLPVVGLLSLRIFAHGAFDGPRMFFLIVVELFLLGPLVTISVIIGVVAFFVSKAKLPDKGWLSAQTLMILLTFVATIAGLTVTVTGIAWP